MINFNVPPVAGNEMDFIQQAIDSHKICGDGEFTKKCSELLEQMTGVPKVMLTTSCTHATEMTVRA